MYIKKNIDLRRYNGRPKKYTPDEWEQKIIEYFDFMATQTRTKKEVIKGGDRAGEIIDVITRTPLTRTSLCVFAGIDRETLGNYLSKQETYIDFFRITAHACQIIDNDLLEGGLNKEYDSNLTARMIFKETTTQSVEDQNITIKIKRGSKNE